MLRVGIARAGDWGGSVVDFIAKGLARFCRQHRGAALNRVFSASGIRILDEILERSEIERIQNGDAASNRMFILVDYEQSAMIQIGPTLDYLGRLGESLPAAFYRVFADSLSRWMRVYDCRDAEFLAEEQMHMMDEEEKKESFYPNVANARPICLKDLPESEEAVECLQKAGRKIKSTPAREIIRLCLSMHETGQAHEPAWPSRLRDQLPELEEYFECTEGPGPGSLIVFEEEDLIEACYTEEMQYLGQNYSIGSTLMLLVDLDQSPTLLDQQVNATFDYIRTMLEALSSAAELIEIIRGIYDADLRQRRMEPGIQTEAGPAVVR